jgi:hypothetical protein
MSFVHQLIKSKKKIRNIVPKKGTISYCKYMIDKIQASKRTRLEKQSEVVKWHAAIESIREAKEDRRQDRVTFTARRMRDKAEYLELQNSILKDRVAELERLLKLAPELNEDPNILIEAIKPMGINLTGKNGVYRHRESLPAPFNQWSRHKLEAVVWQLIRIKKLSRLPCGTIM